MAQPAEKAVNAARKLVRKTDAIAVFIMVIHRNSDHAIQVCSAAGTLEEKYQAHITNRLSEAGRTAVNECIETARVVRDN